MSRLRQFPYKGFYRPVRLDVTDWITLHNLLDKYTTIIAITSGAAESTNLATIQEVKNQIIIQLGEMVTGE